MGPLLERQQAIERPGNPRSPYRTKNSMRLNFIRNRTLKGQRSSDDELICILKESALFGHLSQRSIKKISKVVQKEDFAEGEAIFNRGEIGLGLYIIKKGSVDILKDRGKVAHLEEGDFFGELSLLDEYPNPVCAVASGNSELIIFHRSTLMKLIAEEPRLALKILIRLDQMTGERVHAVNEEIEAVQAALEIDPR